jgi:hypothetical protein
VALPASAHHERLDGSGYPDALTADALTMPMALSRGEAVALGRGDGIRMAG